MKSVEPRNLKVTITVGEVDIWEKLAAIQKIDPAVSGGIDSVVLGQIGRAHV